MISCAILALITLSGLTGCSNDPAITPELHLAPILADGTAPYHLGVTDEGVQQYAVAIGDNVTVNLVWAPQAPAGQIDYEVTHVIGLASATAETRGGPSVIDGSISVSLEASGRHTITVKAMVGDRQVGAAQVILEAD